MSVDRQADGATANQQWLMAELGRLRRLLAARIEPAAGSDPSLLAPPPPASAATSPDAPTFGLELLARTFGLSPFERDLLLLCAGPDLDSGFAPLLARATGDPRRTTPTFGLALALLPEAHWSALLPTAPLRRWRLIEPGTGEHLTASPLRVDEWVLHFLAGTPQQDQRLHSLVQALRPSATPPAEHLPLGDEVVRHWRETAPRQAWPLVELCGESLDDQLTIGGHVASRLGWVPYRLTGADLPAVPAEREALARLWEREAALNGALLLVDFHEAEPGDSLRGLAAWLDSLNAPVLLLAREPTRAFNRNRLRVPVPRLSAAGQHALWREHLGPQASACNGQLERVAGQFTLSAREIQNVSHGLRLAASAAASPDARGSDGASGDRGALWRLCRAQTGARLETLAQRLEPVAEWRDLVLPEEPLSVLREVCRHVRHRFRVYEQWGFATKGTRGLGISALFAGSSGTGKTLAAEVLARELDLDLFRIDLSAVVSKYIGETEKNLRRVFDAAEAGGAVLLFDEADALFGKRSEVKDSHDRYANIEVGYLLQRMETYRGLAILTTNFKQALDPAFLRRLRFVVQFPFPDADQRAEIWRRVFPAATPTAGLDPTRLARLNVAGGNIRNIALNAAFLAAETNEAVGMKHLLQAARSECAKLERPPSASELGGWT